MYQKLTVIGYLGREPEMRFLLDGTAVTNLNVATTRKWTDRNGQSADETTWFRVSVWGKQAEAANQYLTKGSMVLVEGRLKVNAETGGPNTFKRNDGTVGASFEVIADTVRFLDRKGEAPTNGGNTASHSSVNPGGKAYDEEDEIPF